MPAAASRRDREYDHCQNCSFRRPCSHETASPGVGNRPRQKHGNRHECWTQPILPWLGWRPWLGTFIQSPKNGMSSIHAILRPPMGSASPAYPGSPRPPILSSAWFSWEVFDTRVCTR
jgi:hypothetical protein